MLHELMLNEVDLLYRTGDSLFNAEQFQRLQIIEGMSLHTGFTHINIECEIEDRAYGVQGVITPEIRANTNNLGLAIRSMLLMMYVNIMTSTQGLTTILLTRRYYPLEPNVCWRKEGF